MTKIIAVVLLGILLRLVYPFDFEYKYDQKYLFEKTQTVQTWADVPALGMPSGVGLRNPGMSTWVFLGLGKLFGVQTPVGLNLAVVLMNCLALAVLAWMVSRKFQGEEQQNWFWTLALIAVNPLAIKYDRIIWAQSVLPVLCFVSLALFLDRKKAWASLGWGLLGTVIAQIHMTGFMFLPAVVLWLWAIRDRWIRWKSFFVGCALGAIPMIPWVFYLFSPEAVSDVSPTTLTDRWIEWTSFQFWIYWLTQGLGLHLGWTLGADWSAFLRQPWVALAHAILLGVGVFCVGVVLRESVPIFRGRKKWLTQWRTWGGRAPALYLIPAGVIFGLLVHLPGKHVYRHYLIIATPFIFYFWVCWIRWAIPKRWQTHWRMVLAVVCLCQLVIVAAYLHWVHVHGGAAGEYGRSYRSLNPSSR